MVKKGFTKFSTTFLLLFVQAWSICSQGFLPNAFITVSDLFPPSEVLNKYGNGLSFEEYFDYNLNDSNPSPKRITVLDFDENGRHTTITEIENNDTFTHNYPSKCETLNPKLYKSLNCDSAGRVIHAISYMGHSTYNEYDIHSRLVKSTEVIQAIPAGLHIEQTTLTYKNGNISAVHTQNGLVSYNHKLHKEDTVFNTSTLTTFRWKTNMIMEISTVSKNLEHHGQLAELIDFVYTPDNTLSSVNSREFDFHSDETSKESGTIAYKAVVISP